MNPRPLYHDNRVVFWPIGIPKIAQSPFNQDLAVPREVKGVIKGGQWRGVNRNPRGGLWGHWGGLWGNRGGCRRGIEGQ